MTKALTGLVIADAVSRGEIAWTDVLGAYLDLATSPAADITLAEVVTHTSGLPRLGTETLRRGMRPMLAGQNPYGATTADLLRETRAARIRRRGRFAYSNIGGALAGQAVASAAGMTYPELMRIRLFARLGMTETEVQTRPLVQPGHRLGGRPVEPWVFDGYAPAGGVVTTSADLAKLARAVLQGRAPGMAALRSPVGAAASRPGPGRRTRTGIGIFWLVTRTRQGTDVVWHNGMTGGYAAFVGFDLSGRRAVAVLSDVAKPVDRVGWTLLERPS